MPTFREIHAPVVLLLRLPECKNAVTTAERTRPGVDRVLALELKLSVLL